MDMDMLAHFLWGKVKIYFYSMEDEKYAVGLIVKDLFSAGIKC